MKTILDYSLKQYYKSMLNLINDCKPIVTQVMNDLKDNINELDTLPCTEVKVEYAGSVGHYDYYFLFDHDRKLCIRTILYMEDGNIMLRASIHSNNRTTNKVTIEGVTSLISTLLSDINIFSIILGPLE